MIRWLHFVFLRSCTVDTRAIPADLLESTARRGASRMRVNARGIRALLRTRGPEHRRAAQLEGNHLSDASAPSPSPLPDPPIHHEHHLHTDLECNRYWTHQNCFIVSLHLINSKFRSYYISIYESVQILLIILIHLLNCTRSYAFYPYVNLHVQNRYLLVQFNTAFLSSTIH